MPPVLDGLGTRIAILGPSNAGKSTLAQLLGERFDLPVTHIDQLAHYPNTAWKRRPDDELIAAHNDIISQDKWIIEGNYSSCICQRLDRATAVIWLDLPLPLCIFRYLKRCIQNDVKRIGGLPGAKSELSWNLILFTLQMYPKNKKKYKSLLAEYPDLNIQIITKPFPLDALNAL